ncbi:MAG: Zn-dependent alcohol dehydrogenase [Acidimicrobiia bacterium]|nr:Zn-dependent alcohol dehydrogenase [Acidimicrobiia bacterium]
MRAAVLRATGDTTLDVVDTIELDDLGATDVRVEIKATGVCHSDLHGMDGALPQPAPAVLGHEGAGVVVEVGPAVTSVSVGDHVIVAWTPPCGRCAFCTEHGQPQLCMEIQFQIAVTPRFREHGEAIFGFVGTGTFAEQLILPQEAVVRIEPDIPFDIASLIGCGVTTGVGAALNAAKVRPGARVVVFGCGGVGMSVIAGAQLAGAATIVAVDLNPAKEEAARKFGATHFCGPDDLDELKGELTDGLGFDDAFEAIGLPVTMRAAYDAVRRGGTVVIVGVGRAEQTVSFNAFELFFDEKTIKGSVYGSADVRHEFGRLLRLWKAGRLDLEGLITKRDSLDGINDAISELRAGNALRTVIEF